MLDHIEDFYNDYDVLVIIGGSFLTILLTCFFSCCCWI